MTDPAEILDSGGETYARKNDDYGDSWRKVGEILHNLSDGEAVELNTVEDHISYGLFTRRLDKLARAYNGEFVADDMNYESIIDSHEDEMTYAAMHSSNQRSRDSGGGGSHLLREFKEAVDAVQKMWSGFGDND